MKSIIISFFLGALCLFSNKAIADDELKHKFKIGDIAPNIELISPDGSTKHLSDYKGKVIMLQFTASWCPVCRKEMPFIEKEIWHELKSNPNFVLFGIDLKEGADTVAIFKKSTKITYPLLLDPKGAAFDAFTEEGAGVTRNIIIDKDGKIVFQTRLFKRDEFDKMKEIIFTLVNKSSE
jgi:peroxiredoxin